jgi:CDP-paratose 2-epimerase
MPLINTNLLGTVNCLELAKKRNAAFIFLSTSRVYPIDTLENADFVELDKRYAWTDNQLISGISSRGIQENFPISGSRSFYGSTKLASELLIDEYHALTGMKTVVNRCGVLSGPWQMGKIDQGVLVLWLARHYFDGSLKYIGFEGKGKQTRDVLHIDDLVRLIDWQIHHIDQVNGETFNVGGGIDVSFSLLELTELCQEVTGNKIQILPELQTRTADIKIYITDNTKVTSTTGWSPTKSMKDLVQDTYNWMKENEKSLKQILN